MRLAYFQQQPGLRGGAGLVPAADLGPLVDHQRGSARGGAGRRLRLLHLLRVLRAGKQIS